MADPFKVLEASLIDELAAIHREVVAAAQKKKVMGGKEDGTIIEVTLKVDLEVVLENASATTREVRQVGK